MEVWIAPLVFVDSVGVFTSAEHSMLMPWPELPVVNCRYVVAAAAVALAVLAGSDGYDLPVATHGFEQWAGVVAKAMSYGGRDQDKSLQALKSFQARVASNMQNQVPSLPAFVQQSAPLQSCPKHIVCPAWTLHAVSLWPPSTLFPSRPSISILSFHTVMGKVVPNSNQP